MESMGGGCSNMCWMYMYLYMHTLVKEKDGLGLILKPSSYGFKELSPFFWSIMQKVFLLFWNVFVWKCLDALDSHLYIYIYIYTFCLSTEEYSLVSHALFQGLLFLDSFSFLSIIIYEMITRCNHNQIN